MKQPGARSRSEAETFLIDFVQFCRDEIHGGAPREVLDRLKNGLRAPRDDDDFMVVAYHILAASLPEELLRRDLIGTPKDQATAQRQAALAAIVVHRGWQRIRVLEKRLVARIAPLKAKRPHDWQRWMFLTFELVRLTVQRNLHDLQVSLEKTIASDDQLLEEATELYRATLHEGDLPPFTRYEIGECFGQMLNLSEATEPSAA
jgi:hypothetical protein